MCDGQFLWLLYLWRGVSRWLTISKMWESLTLMKVVEVDVIITGIKSYIAKQQGSAINPKLAERFSNLEVRSSFRLSLIDILSMLTRELQELATEIDSPTLK